MRLGMKCPLETVCSRIYVCHLSIPRKRHVRRRASFAVTPVTSTGIKVRAVKENDKGKPVADRCDRLRRRQSRGTLAGHKRSSVGSGCKLRGLLSGRAPN